MVELPGIGAVNLEEAMKSASLLSTMMMFCLTFGPKAIDHGLKPLKLCVDMNLSSLKFIHLRNCHSDDKMTNTVTEIGNVKWEIKEALPKEMTLPRDLSFERSQFYEH